MTDAAPTTDAPTADAATPDAPQLTTTDLRQKLIELRSQRQKQIGIRLGAGHSIDIEGLNIESVPIREEQHRVNIVKFLAQRTNAHLEEVRLDREIAETAATLAQMQGKALSESSDEATIITTEESTDEPPTANAG